MSAASNLDKHQLAGLDNRERGFSRPVELESDGHGYRAILRYERLVIATETHETQDLALQTLVDTLQTRGFHQLKTQMSFRRGTYLGSQEQWVEYPDPQQEPVPLGLLSRIANWFKRPPSEGAP